MNNTQRAFAYHIQDMNRKGYRTYFIEDVDTFEKRAGELARDNQLQIELCDPFRVIFVKEAKKEI